MNGWNAADDLKDYIHPYWTKFEEPNPMLHQMLGVIYIFFLIVSTLGNGCVIWIFSTTKELKTASNVLIMNLAICDFIMMIKNPVFIYNSFNLGPVFGKTGCHIFALMGAYIGPCAAVSNAAIAYDRYRCITDPMGKRWSNSQASMVVLACWIYASPPALLPYLEIWGRYVPEGYLTSCSFDYMTEDNSTRLFTFVLWFWDYFVPLTVIVFCYSKITSQVMNHEKELKAQAAKMNVASLRSGEQAKTRNEIRVAKVGISLTLVFLSAWTPYTAIAFIAAYGDRNKLTPFHSMIPALGCKLTACIDPFIYAINHPKYRMELQKRMPWMCVHEPEEPKDTGSTGTAATANSESA
jgi:r-opsin